MESFSLVIVGITSNLSQIKLIPTLYDLVASGLLPKDYRIVGIGRTPMDDTAFTAFVDQTLHTPNRHHTHDIDSKIQAELMSHLTYLPADLTDQSSYSKLNEILNQSPKNRLFYLATFPSLYESIFNNLKSAGLINESSQSWVRLMIEKPIGHDEDSARELNSLLTSHFREDQLFRLDHYLGKETLQNILTFRFGNGLLEPIMNSNYIDHIQVTAAEDFGIGSRGSYYDQNGALKDVGQNHLLQMIALATMDAPASYSTQDIMTKRVEAIESLIPIPGSLVLGQYIGYIKEKDVSPLSVKDTYFAFKTHLTRTRFANIPIYVRGGKRLARTATEISIVFKNSAERVLSHLPGGANPNVLIYRLQPNEGIVLRMLTKVPGHEMKVEESYMQYCYPKNKDLPDAYERLIIDAIHGDQTFFNDSREVEAQWRFTDALYTAVTGTPELYEKGSWGPKQSDAMIQKDGRSWLEPSIAICNF